MINVRVYRFEPGKDAAGRLEEYGVESDGPLSVMALLAKIRDIDPGFACRTSLCYKGGCGSCLVRVNGKDVKGCVTLVSPGETVVVEPHSGYRVIRDVVVDFAAPTTGGTAARGE
jgi:succinate dehydrogenase / fumarate reductase iron-sulfur subunit